MVMCQHGTTIWLQGLELDQRSWPGADQSGSRPSHRPRFPVPDSSTTDLPIVSILVPRNGEPDPAIAIQACHGHRSPVAFR